MKILIVEDDEFSQYLMKEILVPYGTCDVSDNGIDAFKLYIDSVERGEFYNLICLDIMMPEMNGQETLRKIRAYEEESGFAEEKRAKVIMVTALEDFENITKAFKNKCEAYIVKPLEKDKIIETLDYLGLLES